MSRKNSGSDKVYWTSSEKASIVKRAIEIQKDRPDLSGLPLLRAAIHSLPEHRRRKILTLPQVPWFEEGILAYAALAAERMGESTVTVVQSAAGPDDPYLPFFSAILGELVKLNSTMSACGKND